MTDKLKIWSEGKSWEESEKLWELKSQRASEKKILKGLDKLPSMPGITKETAKNLKWKSFKWMVSKDHQREVFRGVFKHPIKYGIRYLKSILKSKSYVRDGDFYLYGMQDLEEFQKYLETPDTIFVVGFSYCHKPFECPSGRFTPDCIHDADHPVCGQCFIGKVRHALPEKDTIPLVIPTVHYIGGQIFKIIHQNPNKRVIFLITACEMTLEMFGDFGNMTGIVGVGVRLDGRICNTMKAFELSEEGIKPGLTVVLDETKKKFLELIKRRRAAYI